MFAHLKEENYSILMILRHSTENNAERSTGKDLQIRNMHRHSWGCISDMNGKKKERSREHTGKQVCNVR